jgi:hypothetical protein
MQGEEYRERQARRSRPELLRKPNRSGGQEAMWEAAGGFLDEASEIEEAGKGISDEGGLGGIVQAEVRRALEAEAGLGGIAGFGIGLSADAEMPEVRIDLDIASQADGAVREGEANGKGHAEGMIRIGERAGGKRWLAGDGDVGLGLVQALAAAEPLGGMTGEVVAVRGEGVTVRAEGGAVLVIAALDTDEGLVIVLSVANADGAQGMQVGVDVGEDVIVAFSGIAEVLADLEGGEAGAQISQAGDGEGVVIVVGRGEGAGDGPEDEQAVIDDIEGLGFVAEVMLAVGSGTLLGILVRIGAVVGLVGTG